MSAFGQKKEELKSSAPLDSFKSVNYEFDYFSSCGTRRGSPKSKYI